MIDEPGTEPIGGAADLDADADLAELITPSMDATRGPPSRDEPPDPAESNQLEPVFEAATYDGAPSDGEDEWSRPIALGAVDPPPFPTDALPGFARDWVEGQSEALQVPTDLPGTMVLATVAAACAKRARVQLKPGYLEPLNLYVVTALEPANRKSPVFKEATRPLADLERALREDARETVAVARARIDGLQARSQRAIRAVGTASPEDMAARQTEAADLAVKLTEAESNAPVLPRILTDDVTPEQLGVLLERHDGVMAVFSPEGGEVFEIARGRYSTNGRGNLSIFLSGHSGDTIRIDRVGRDDLIVDDPSLTLCLTVQNDVIRDLDAPHFRGRGFLGRFLYSIPTTFIGNRNSRSTPVPGDINAVYNQAICGLAQTKIGENVILLDGEAQEAWYRFSEDLEPRLGSDGDLGQISDWAGKLAGTVGRIAGLLHAAEHANDGRWFDSPIRKPTMERAIQIGHYFIGHAKIAFDLMRVSPEMELARRILRWIRAKQMTQVSKRDIFQRFKGGTVQKTREIDGPLGILVDHGYLRERPTRDGAGRKSESYDVNPMIEV